MSKGILNGVIILGERITGNPFSETEKEYLMDIASLAGIAIQNAYLYEMATTDMMTRLKIHHYFQTQLLEEIERANRTAKPLSLIMLDIDHFKQFNDTYGHTAGDLVLIEVARTIKEHVRPMDTAARYGGEEFAVILPRTDLEEAKTVAERVRDAIQEQVVTYENQSLSVTVSVGLTEYNPRKDKRSTQVIERADRALYMSKQDGRNRVSHL
jgi:diguanylate cyclase (GGDEF)-like protein